MREDYGNISLVTGDDGFGDMGFDAEPPELMRDTNSLEPSLEKTVRRARGVRSLRGGGGSWGESADGYVTFDWTCYGKIVFIG